MPALIAPQGACRRKTEEARDAAVKHLVARRAVCYVNYVELIFMLQRVDRDGPSLYMRRYQFLCRLQPGML